MKLYGIQVESLYLSADPSIMGEGLMGKRTIRNQMLLKT